MWFRQESTAILIADLDGLRSSLCLKGSAGIKPCLRCLNCVKKDSGLDPMHYPDITNPSFAQFRQIQNKDIWNLADALQKMVDDGESKAKIQKFEKAAGLVFFGDGLFYQPRIRERMPPTHVCVDGMHCYYSNGCASWEIALCLDAVTKASHWTLRFLRDAVVQSAWTGPKGSKHIYASYLKGLFSEKNVTEVVYKGQAAQCESLVPLLRYYFAEGNLKEEHLQPHLKSFEDLAMCCAQLRALRYQWSEIVPQDVDSLLAVQERHQKSFLECYSAECIKPKHHQRFHLGQSFVQMNIALRCEQHESKHRCYKHGLAERLKSTARCGFQKSLLPRLLSGQAARVQELGVQPVRLIGPFKAACPELCNLLGDSNMKIAKGVRYYHSSVSKTDILYFADGSAAVVQNICTNDVEHFFLLQKLHRVRSCGWGTVWQATEKQALASIFAQPWSLPPWWRWQDDMVTCLL